MKVSAVYIIQNLIDKKIYIGQSKDARNRLRKHKEELLRGAHCNTHLQNSFTKFGESNFEFDILQDCKEDLLLALEHFWVKTLRSDERDFGYNLKQTHPYKVLFMSDCKRVETAKNSIGKKRWTQESKKKSIESRRKTTEERGYYHTEEGRTKISLSRKGKTSFLGKKHTEIAKEKMRIAALSKPNNGISHKCREAFLSKTNYAKPMLGKKHPQEVIDKIKKARALQKNIYRKNVEQYDLDGNLVKIWNSLTEVANYIGKSSSMVNYISKNKKEYFNSIWKIKNYKNER